MDSSEEYTNKLNESNMEYIEFTMNEIKDKIMRGIAQEKKDLESTISELHRTIKQQNGELIGLREDIIKADNYSRRLNLELHFVEDYKYERPEELLRKIHATWLKMGLGTPNFRLERWHRIGPYQEGKSRMTLIRFSFFQDRTAVWNARGQLQGKGIFLSENFHPTTAAKNGDLCCPLSVQPSRCQTIGEKFS